ncbi:unnamed protein product [Durusdinium trenchii]
MSGIKRADVARLVALSVYGGVYADIDVEATRSLEPLLHAAEATNAAVLLGEENLVHSVLLEHKAEPLVSNAVMIGAAGHPFWEEVLQEIFSRSWCGEDPVQCTGPRIVDRVSWEHLRRNPACHKSGCVLRLRYDYFSPNIALWNAGNMVKECRPRDRYSRWSWGSTSKEKERMVTDACRSLSRALDRPTALHSNRTFAVHHWQCSWCREDEALRKSVSLAEIVWAVMNESQAEAPLLVTAAEKECQSKLGQKLTKEALGPLQRVANTRCVQADLEKPLLLYSEDSDAVFSSRLEFQEQLPRLNELLTAYYKMFQLDEELLVSVILAPLCHEATHAFSCTTTFQEICLLEDCNDRKDAAALQPPQAWPFLQDGLVGLRGPAGSLAFSLEAADALAEVLHRRAPISTYECFMQSLKSRSRSRQSPHARQPKADPHVAIDEEVELDFTEGGSVSSRVPKEAEQAGWLQDFLSDSPGVVKRRQQMLQALQAWEALSQNLTQEAFTALAEEKLDALTLTVRAEALLRLGRLEEAAKDCVQALRIFPESSMTTLVQAEVNLRLGYPADCLEDCNHLLDWNPRCSQASALRGEARLSLGHLDEAILDCDWALAHGHRSAAVLAVRGNAHRKLGNIREAISDADEALRECPSCCEALLLRGQAQLELREAGAALADLTKAIDIPHAASEVRVSALASRADAFVALQRYDKAITDCDEALTISRSPLALAIRGEAQLLSCEYQAALEDCSAALALEPTDPYTLAVRAEAHLCLGHRDDSIGDCDQALELSPGLEYAVLCSDYHIQ